MRALFLSAAIALLVLSSGLHVNAQTSAPTAFTIDLALGSSGPQVLALQQVLNQDATTRIASSGPGSPGNETGYFGPLTTAAVMRFQEKYASQILVPAGLTQPTGFVGSYTRTMLNAVSVLAAGSGAVSTPTVAPTTVAPSISTSTTTSQNTTQQTLDTYIAAVNALGSQQGMSSNTLSLVDSDVRQEMATSTDFLQQFFDQQRAMYEKQSLSTNIMASPISALLQDLSIFANETFMPQTAYAGVLPPFGGFITLVVPCTCAPAVASVFVALAYPNPIVTNLLLDYVLGSEGFNWHNIPEPGIATLGLYVPGVAPLCFIGFPPFCVPLPSEGVITPVSGSSLSPG